MKFDEFSYLPNIPTYGSDYIDKSPYKYDSKKIKFITRVERFAQEVLKQPNSTAYIIFYNQRKGKYPLDYGKMEGGNAIGIINFIFDQLKYVWQPNSKYKTSFDRITAIDGGYRENPTLEFWVVPQNAEPPKPTPTFSSTEIAVCPDINVAGDGFRKDRTQPLKFSVAISGEQPNSKLDLEWNVSAGNIVKGQGTNQIEVDLTDTNAKTISASVQVKGLHPECNNHNFASTQVGFYPLKIDETGRFVPSDFSNRLQNLNLYIQNEPNSIGYIIIYGSRDDYKNDVSKTIKFINQSFEFLKYSKDRIKVIDGGYRDEMTIEYFVVPAGVEPPKPTPTVDEKFIVAPKKVVKKHRKSSK